MAKYSMKVITAASKSHGGPAQMENEGKEARGTEPVGCADSAAPAIVNVRQLNLQQLFIPPDLRNRLHASTHDHDIFKIELEQIGTQTPQRPPMKCYMPVNGTRTSTQNQQRRVPGSPSGVNAWSTCARQTATSSQRGPAAMASPRTPSVMLIMALIHPAEIRHSSALPDRGRGKPRRKAAVFRRSP